MNDIMMIGMESTVRMNSLEIAELVEKRHDNVKRTIESLSNQGVIVRPQIEDEHSYDAVGRSRKTQVYVFEGEQGRLDSIVTVAQLCAEFTARLVRRWDELEKEAAKTQPQLPDFNNPAEAARAWADQFEGREEAEALALEHQKKIEENIPKVEYYEAVGDSSGLMTIGEAVKSMNNGLGRNKAMAMLRAMKILQSSSTYWNQPYQQYIDQGYFQMKQKVIPTGQMVATTLVTSKGHQWLYKKFNQ